MQNIFEMMVGGNPDSYIIDRFKIVLNQETNAQYIEIHTKYQQNSVNLSKIIINIDICAIPHDIV